MYTTSNIYYENISKDRTFLLQLVARAYPFASIKTYKHYTKGSVRGLNRLSTAQLINKLKSAERRKSAHLSQYVENMERQRQATFDAHQNRSTAQRMAEFDARHFGIRRNLPGITREETAVEAAYSDIQAEAVASFNN